MSSKDFKLIQLYQFCPQRIKRFCQQAILSLLCVGILAACQTATVEPPSSPTSATMRSLEHAMGITEVPENPKRVVVLDTAPLDAAIALGVTPVGALANDSFPQYLGDRTAEITAVGVTNQPNLEKIALLQPDLILSSKVNSAAIYPELVQIAPTILTESNGRDGQWPGNLQLFGEALAKSNEATQLLDDYQQQVATFQQQVENPSEIVAAVLFYYQGQIGLYTDTSFSGSVLTDLGLSLPPIPTRFEAAPHLTILSEEVFNDFDVDFVFFMAGTSDEQFSFEEFVNHPLYSQLPAVKNGRVYPIQGEVWGAGRNILAAQQIVQDVADALVQSSSK